MAEQQALNVPDPYARVIAKIDDLATLPPGWNSYRAVPINAYARARAKSLVLQFYGYAHQIPAPTVAPTPTGGVMLHWDLSGLEVEIVFDPTGGAFSVAEVDSSELLAHGDSIGDPYKEVVLPYIAGRS